MSLYDVFMKPRKILIAYSIFTLLGFFNTPLFAQQALDLSEAEFNQNLQIQIDIVNQTKSILDDPNLSSSLKEQGKALCQRIQAYQKVAALSEDYPQFETSSFYQMVAKRYLAQQKQSFEASGMNISSFCSE